MYHQRKKKKLKEKSLTSFAASKCECKDLAVEAIDLAMSVIILQRHAKPSKKRENKGNQSSESR
jgi:hypothetical protein